MSVVDDGAWVGSDGSVAAGLVQIDVEEERSRWRESEERDMEKKWNAEKREIRIKERIKISKIIKCNVNDKKKIKNSAQPKKAVYCNCGVKKYSFGSTIVGHILIFSSAKNSNIVI